MCYSDQPYGLPLKSLGYLQKKSFIALGGGERKKEEKSPPVKLISIKIIFNSVFYFVKKNLITIEILTLKHQPLICYLSMPNYYNIRLV